MKIMTALLSYLTVSLCLASAQADSTATRKKHYNLKKGVAIQGYDPVSYLDNNKATKGKSIYVNTHDGVKYRFSSKGNLTKFKKNPEKYEPQYGGWCAYALSEGNGKVAINPTRFKVIKGKVYLFYDKLPWGNTLKKWNKGSDASQVTQASEAWKGIIAK
jgi:YHS domain-containing protein